MDPLTHTLVGANLASTRLGAKTPLAAAALVIGANAPDIDAISYAFGSDVALGFRRGWTHGLLALVVLPLVVAGLLLLWDRWVRRNRDEPARPWMLLVLSFVAILTHPFLDWLNNYGMRWLMPFEGTWFYGDAVFIMDPWLWLILGGPWLLGQRRSLPLLATWAVFAGLVVAVVFGRAPAYLPIVIAVAAALLLALFMKPGVDEARFRHRMGIAGATLAGAYVIGMLGLHALTLGRVEAMLAANRVEPVRRLMVGPMPVNPFAWSVVAQLPDVYVTGNYRWWDGGLSLDSGALPVPGNSTAWNRARNSPAAEGFITWTRFPWYEVEETHAGTRVFIMDARYARTRAGGFGSTSVLIDDRAGAGR